MSSNLRAMKTRQVFNSLKSHGEFRSRQGEIWDEIEAKAARMEAPSGTMAMSDIYEKEHPPWRNISNTSGLLTAGWVQSS